MSFADCTACRRRHKRSVNTKCDYAKLAVEKCASLGLSSSQYLHYLPELLVEDVDTKMAGKSKDTQASPGAIPSQLVDNELISQLLGESVQSRKLLESSQAQVERMMAQLLDLKIGHSKMAANEAAQVNQGASGGPPPGTERATLSANATGGLSPIVSGGGHEPVVSKRPGSFPPGLNLPLPVHASVPFPTGAAWTSQAGAYLPSTLQQHGDRGPGALAGGPLGPSAAVSSTPAAVPIPGALPGGFTTQHFPVQHGVTVNPYLPPYLLPGASQQSSLQIPYRCETDHAHPPRHTCTTAKRKLQIYDLEVHMRYASSSTVTIDDIIAGSLSLLESMLRQGVDGTGYVRHIRFLVEKSKIYVSSALIGYDAEMRERAEFYGSSVFTYGDHDLTHRWLGVESLKTSVSIGGQSIAHSAGKKKPGKSTKYGSCWGWNENRSCKTSPCKYKHVCSSCQGEHKQLDCPTHSKTPTTASKVNK